MPNEWQVVPLLVHIYSQQSTFRDEAWAGTAPALPLIFEANPIHKASSRALERNVPAHNFRFVAAYFLNKPARCLSYMRICCLDEMAGESVEFTHGVCRKVNFPNQVNGGGKGNFWDVATLCMTTIIYYKHNHLL
jgi:hypothetical protein